MNPPAVDGRFSYYEKLVRLWGRSYLYSWPFEHLGLMSIAAYSSNRGIDVLTINGMVENHSSVDQTWARVLETAATCGVPSLVGISDMVDYVECIELARRAKATWPGVCTVLGHNLSTLNYKALCQFTSVFDYYVIGDGERAFFELARAVLDNKRPVSIPGTAVRLSGPPVVNELDLPDFAELEWPSRAEIHQVLALGMSPSIFTKRGCPYRCAFCATGAVSDLARGKGYRARQVEDVVNEIEMLRKDFEIPHLTIVDDLFLTRAETSRAWAIDFGRELMRRAIKVPFMLDTRVDSISKEVFTVLYRAGLRSVFVGIESGHRQTLEGVFKKRLPRVQDPLAQLRMLEEIGIKVIPGFILFHPKTGREELLASLPLIDLVGRDNPGVFRHALRAYLGTPLYHELVREGLIEGAWPSTQWAFKDENAATMFARIRRFTKHQDNLTYEDARDCFVRELYAWEQGLSPYLPDEGSC